MADANSSAHRDAEPISLPLLHAIPPQALGLVAASRSFAPGEVAMRFHLAPREIEFVATRQFVPPQQASTP